jgi:beta-ribofuranosylaminobenzene 5'-phosphate synthase
VVESVRSGMSPKGRYDIHVNRSLPFHVGLGARTQLSLAIGTAVAKLDGMDVGPREVAEMVGRGGTSGIGVMAFEKGGFIVDGGHSFAMKRGFLPSRFSNAPPPPVMFHSKLPDQWVFIVAIPGIHPDTLRKTEEGMSGEAERSLFESRCPVPADETANIARIVLMQAIPAVIEGDLAAFGAAVDGLQHLGFKKVENELRGADGKALMWLMKENGASGCGLSSFGPATFGVVQEGPRANRLENAVRDYLIKDGRMGLVFRARPAGHGAVVEEL